ncbi:MAG: T9SS type A sorting domain-containing protein [Bacteroidetes bacterium]|nr:T9SS type A sorting domain-containing protein [Bacteroidota bacterium]
MNYRVLALLFVLIRVVSPAQHTNVLISSSSSPNEPTICLDPKQPNILIAASNINNYYISADTGRTWTAHTLSSPLGVWGDPVIIADTASRFYFFHLSNPAQGNWIDRIVCQTTTDNGQSWTDGSYMGLNGAKAQDKEWGIVDQNTNHIYVTWTQFDDYGSEKSTDSTLILFSKSVDNGESWSAAKRINAVAGDCIDSDNTVEGAVPAVGPNGELFVSWVGPEGIIFDRSLDEGESWLEEDIFISEVPGGWDFDIPGIYRCNGMPVTVCDLSGGANHGTIYVNWTDQRNGEDDTDVWLVKSKDGGNSWSAPIRVNDDPPGKQQFLSWMVIDQVTGYLYFIFYDRRNSDTLLTDVYLAISKDGGEIFNNFKISEEPFFPDQGVFFGDYTNIVAHNNIVRPIWTRLHQGDLSIWTALIDQDILTNSKERILNEDTFESYQNYPNPTNDITYVSFKLNKPKNISLVFYDVNGEKVLHPLDHEMYGFGKHILEVNTKNLSSGVYYYTLTIGDKEKTKKIVISD